MIGRIPLNRVLSGILTLWLFIRFTAILFAKHSVAIAVVTTSIVMAVIIFIAAISLAKNLSAIKTKSKILQKDSFAAKSDVLSDAAVSYFKDDILNRKDFISNLYKQISAYPYGDSLSIGLYGKLGEGKTSSLNLLRETILKSKMSENYIVLNFNPWHYKDETAMTQAFFYELKTSMHRGLFDEAGDALKKYSQILEFGTPKVALHKKLTHIEESISELTEKINSAIEKQGKKIIIFIDETERLSKPILMKLFELIQLSASFKNTIYILSFDVNRIAEIVSEEGGMNFVEKIIKMPIHIPAVEQGAVRDFLYSQIENILKKNHISAETGEKALEQFAKIYKSDLEQVIKNLRDSKFLLNAFRINFPSVREEVNVLDFLILTVLRVFYPAVYDDISKNPQHYIFLDKTDDENFPSGASSGKHSSTHIKQLLNREFKDDKETKETILKLLFEIFPVRCQNKFSKVCLNKGQSRQEKRICHKKCFAKYFMLKTPQKEISDEDFKNLIKKWSLTDTIKNHKHISEQIRKLIEEGKFDGFLEQIQTQIGIITADTAKQVLSSISFFDNEMSNKSNEITEMCLYLLKEKIEPQNINRTITDIILKIPGIDFLISFTNAFIKQLDKPKNRIISKNITSVQITNLVKQQLNKRLLKPDKDIFKEIQRGKFKTVNKWVDYYGSQNTKEKKKINDYIFNILAANKKEFTSFLAILANNPHKKSDKKFSFSLRDLAKTYDISKIYEIAVNFSKKQQLHKNEKEIIDSFTTQYETSL